MSESGVRQEAGSTSHFTRRLDSEREREREPAKTGRPPRWGRKVWPGIKKHLASHSCVDMLKNRAVHRAALPAHLKHHFLSPILDRFSTMTCQLLVVNLYGSRKDKRDQMSWLESFSQWQVHGCMWARDGPCHLISSFFPPYSLPFSLDFSKNPICVAIALELLVTLLLGEFYCGARQWSIFF